MVIQTLLDETSVPARYFFVNICFFLFTCCSNMAQATIDKNPCGMTEPNTTASGDLLGNENSAAVPVKKKRGRKPKNVTEAVVPAAGKKEKTVVEGNLDKTLCHAMDAILRKRGLTRQQFCGLLASSEKGFMAPDVLSATRDSIVDEAIGLHQAAKSEVAQDEHLGKFIVHDSPEKILLSSESIAGQARHMFSDSDEAGSEEEDEDESGAESDGALAKAVEKYDAAWMNVADELLSADAVLEDLKPLCSEDAATLVAAMTLPQIRTRLADRLQVPDYAVGRLTGMRARLHLMRMLRKELLKDAGSCDAEQDPPRWEGWTVGTAPSAADALRLQHGAAPPAFDAPWLHTYEVPARYPAPRARSHPGPGSLPEAPESPLHPLHPLPHPRGPLQHSRFPLHAPPRQEELHAAGKNKKMVRFATTAKKCLKNALSAFAHGATQAAVQSVLPI